MIEELHDVLEPIADKLGIYGAHPENTPTDGCTCRCCWMLDLIDRIYRAIERTKVSRTYGELPAVVQKFIEPHEWDNMNISEQRDWAIGSLVIAATVRRTA